VNSRAVVPLLAVGLAVPSAGLAAPSSPSLRLATRVIGFDAPSAAPERGAVYVRLGRVPRRAELEDAAHAGLRYLGAAGSRTYVFALERPAAKRWLSGWDPVVGVAGVRAEDRIAPTLASLLAEGSSPAAEGLGLTVTFWPRATRAEVEALVGQPNGMRLPASASGRLGPDAVAVIGAEAAQWLDLERLLAAEAVAAVGVELEKVLLNDASRRLAGSDALAGNPYGLDGTGVLVGHWDGGAVDTDHPDFGARVRNLTQSEVSAHATHTAGTVLGSGVSRASARGHAPGAEMVALSFDGNPTAERREVKHRFYHHHDNHSWGQNSRTVENFGTYNRVALEFDIDARDLLLLPVKAAGNDGRQSEVIVDRYGFDSLSPDSTAKNSLVVGAAEPDGSLALFSSRGPTEDGRVKPDVVAVGAGVVSTWPGGGYNRTQGTSMSAPGVTGIVALLAELFERGSSGRRMHPDVARGVLVHTARDAFNPGPDYRFGWGIADASAAAELISEDRASGGRHIVRGAVRDGERVEYELEVGPGEARLKVTLSWLDAFLNAPSARRLLNDIDLALVSPSGERFLPWVLDPDNPLQDATRGRNAVDNVEQVVIEAPESGRWTAVVEGTDVSDPDLFVQGFVLLSDQPVSRELARVASDLADRDVPDGQGALEVPFSISERATVDALRVFLDLQHEARGQVRVTLAHPDGTEVVLETEDRSTRRDIYAIYPDLRSYDDDVTPLFGKPANGTWTLRVEDLEAGETGQLRHAELEIDLGGPPNQVPVAAIEGPVEGAPGRARTLSGAGSADPDGDPLTFSWRQVSGPTAPLSGETLDTLRVSVPEDAAVGAEMVFELEVSDGRGGRGAAQHTITVTAPNQPPRVEVSGPERAQSGDEVELDASGTRDPDGDTLTFEWSQTAGPAIEGAAANGPRWRFTVPEVDAETRLDFQVRVSDGRSEPVVSPFGLVVAAPAAGGDPEGGGPSPEDPRTDATGGEGLDDVSGGCRAAGGGTSVTLLGLLGLLGRSRRRRGVAPAR
jgi:subtilisin-like proprotein convertase family protein